MSLKSAPTKMLNSAPTNIVKNYIRDWSNVLKIINSKISEDSPLNMMDKSEVNLSVNFKVSKGPNDFAYLFLPETNVCTRTLTLPNGKEVNIGLRSVGRKLTLCYLDTFVMCDIDISQHQMNNGIHSIILCKKIYDKVVDFASKYKNLVKADTAAAVATVKGLHIYFETSDEYNPEQDNYKMAQFLRQVCDGNYVVKWYLDQTRGFCDKVFGTYRFDDPNEKCYIKSKHVKKACNEPLFMGPNSKNTQFLLKFRRDFSCRIIDLECLSLDSLQIFAQDLEAEVIKKIVALTNEDEFKPLYKSLIKQGFEFQYLILLLATFKEKDEFRKTEFEDENFNKMQKSLTSLFYGKESTPFVEVYYRDSIKKWANEITRYSDILRTKLVNVKSYDSIVNRSLDLKGEIYKDTVEELLKRPVSEDFITLLIAVESNMSYSSREGAMQRLRAHEQSFDFLETFEYDIFMSEDIAFLTNWDAFRVAKDFLDGTLNMNSVFTPLFLDYLEELFSHASHVRVNDQKISRAILKGLFNPDYFEELQLPEGQHMLSKMTKMPDLVKLYKVWNLKNTYSEPVLDTLQLPLSNIRLKLRNKNLEFKVNYSFDDIKGFKKNNKELFVSPTEEELNFYKFLHNAITFYCTLKRPELFDFDCNVKWEFVAKYEDSERLHSELRMSDLIDVGGITRDFMTSMAPRLKDLMIRDHPIAFMLVGDLFIMKMEKESQFTLPLFDNMHSYMYLLCGDADACKCDLLVDSSYNKKEYTCENMSISYPLDELYSNEDTLRTYLKTNMESNSKDFALTILCHVMEGVSRDNGESIYHTHIYGDAQWRSEELDVFFDEYSDDKEDDDDDNELKFNRYVTRINNKLSDSVLSDRNLHYLAIRAIQWYDVFASDPDEEVGTDTDNSDMFGEKYIDYMKAYTKSFQAPKDRRESLTMRNSFLKEMVQNVDKYVGLKFTLDDTKSDETFGEWELDVMKFLNEYVPFDFKRFLKRINTDFDYKRDDNYLRQPSKKSFYLTHTVLRLFKETDVELYLSMYDRTKIRKLDASKLNLNAKEIHFLKVLKNHVSKMFMDFIQGNSDVTADSLIKVLSVEREDVSDNQTFYIDATELLFNKMLHLMTKEEVKLVLNFATGMDTIPVFPDFRFKLEGQSFPTTWTGHTCFYSLYLSDTFKEFADKFAECLMDAYDRGDGKEYIYVTDGYNFPSKVKEEKERLIELILSSGSESQSDVCSRPVASPPPPVASRPVPSRPVASPPVASPPVASPPPPVASRPVPSRPVPSRPVASPPVASRPVPSPIVAGRRRRNPDRVARPSNFSRQISPITPRTPERPVSSSSSSPPRLRRPVNRFDPSRRDRLESVISSILDFYVKE